MSPNDGDTASKRKRSPAVDDVRSDKASQDNHDIKKQRTSLTPNSQGANGHQGKSPLDRARQPIGNSPKRKVVGLGARRGDTPRSNGSALDSILSGIGGDDPTVNTTDSDPSSKSPPRKRAGGGGAASSLRQAAEQRRQQREEADKKSVEARGHQELVNAHYNAVPQRGREWRKNESQIAGLRSLNNWIKSTLIQKFSRPDIPTANLLVLDVGCGKGGDLQKWQSAPQTPALYVGLDPAQVSIDQARTRYAEMTRRRRHGQAPPFEAHFLVKDCFGESLGQIPIVQQVGFDPNVGPDLHGNIGVGRPMRGGFDVISMMFCLHYSYESEAQARGMLKNVVGALKKGGRFLGVMPNSDVISAHVVRHLRGDKAPDPTPPKEEKSMYDDDDDWDPEKNSNAQPAETNDGLANGAQSDEDDWDPEKAIDDSSAAPNQDDDDWDPEAPATATRTTDTPNSDVITGPLEWGNSIYKVKFPPTQALPKTGIFRPAYGWKYFYFLEEAVNVPEYVVPWEAFRALAQDYGLEMLYRKPFNEVWEDEKDDPVLGPLSERMGVRSRDGRFNVSAEEMEAAKFYHAFCFYKI